jgi:hypothetical protein
MAWFKIVKRFGNYQVNEAGQIREFTIDEAARFAAMIEPVSEKISELYSTPGNVPAADRKFDTDNEQVNSSDLRPTTHIKKKRGIEK